MDDAGEPIGDRHALFRLALDGRSASFPSVATLCWSATRGGSAGWAASLWCAASAAGSFAASEARAGAACGWCGSLWAGSVEIEHAPAQREDRDEECGLVHNQYGRVRVKNAFCATPSL